MQSSNESSLSSEQFPVSKTYLYCFGGYNEFLNELSSVSRYDSSTGQWENLPSIPFGAKAYFGAAAIGSRIFLCKGEVKKKHLAEIRAFDCFTNSYVPGTIMERRERFGVAAVNGYLYLSGGQTNLNVPMLTILSSVLKYHPETDQWSSVSSMNVDRAGHQLVELNGKLYAIGGYGRTSAEVYDPETDQWSVLCSPHYEHADFGATVHEGKIYACSDEGFEVYEPERDRWNQLTRLDSKRGRTLVSLNRKLLAIGGGLMDGTKDVWEFDIGNRRWNLSEITMGVARSHHVSLVVHL